ncbi:MAG: hypothetical protein CMP91_04235 [Gammaproteobacteria bacterium]|nr:hypothetical protein [Gammaproteobacteria bacterium]|tara:strand:+ start:159040 stop:161400 length:2361 start_codon:yes stop_codon:yes gene_type:complete
MKKLIYILTGLISLSFALIVIAVIFIANLDLNNHKDWISERFLAQTGRELSINGNIESSFYPWLGIQVEDLEISNPPGFSDSPFLQSEFAALRIRLMPLLSSDYEIDTVQLRGTSVNLEVDAQGNNNWGFTVDDDGDTDITDPDTGAGPGAPFNQLIIGGVQVEGVNLSYNNAQTGQQISASDISILVPELIYGEPLEISAQLQLRANQPEVESALSINSIVTYDLDNNRYAVENLTMDFLDSQLLASLSSDNGTISGSLEFSTERSSDILALAGQAALSEQIRSISLSMNLDGSGQSLNLNPLQLSLELSDATLSRPSSVNLQAQAQIDLEDENLEVSNFTLNALELSTQGKLRIDDFSGDPQISGELNLSAFNPRTLAALLNVDLPATRDSAVLQELAFSTDFRASGETASLSGIVLQLDQTRIDGSFSINSFTANDYAFALDIDQLDLDRYLAPESNQTQEAASTEPSELPLETLRDLRLDGSIAIAEFMTSGMSLSNVVLNMQANDGLISLDPARADLYQGSFNGTLSLDARSATPLFSLDSNLQGINLQAISNDFIGASYVSGQGNISLALTGSGSEAQTITRNLNGNADIAINDGVFYGVDVGAVLAQLETMLQSRRLLNVNRGEQTSFENLSAAIRIENGIATTNDLLIESPGFNISGNGTLANLQNNTLNFNLLASVNNATASVESEEYDIGGYSLPIACTGNMNSPRCLPDINSLFNQAVGNVIQEEVGGLLNRVLGGDRNNQDGSEENQDNTDNNEENNNNAAEELFNNALESLFR